MKLCHFDFQKPFELTSEIVQVLVVEGENHFAKYCLELLQAFADDSNFCLYDGEKSVKLNKISVIVTDVLSLDVESKKAVTKFLADLKTIAESQFLLELSNVQIAIAQLMQKLDSQSLCQLDYAQDSDITNIFKAVNVKIYQDNDSLLERLTNFIKVNNRYLGIKNFFFVNLKCFLTDTDLRVFYNEARLEAVNLFLLENVVKEKLPNEQIRIVDRDLCEIIV